MNNVDELCLLGDCTPPTDSFVILGEFLPEPCDFELVPTWHKLTPEFRTSHRPVR